MPEEKTFKLPLFPLSIVVFPDEKLNLHIFEPRYKQLITDSIKQGSTFGISPYVNGKLNPKGTEVKLLEISKIYEDGKMDVKTQGVKVFDTLRFERLMPDKLYPYGEVTFIPDQAAFDFSLEPQILELTKELFSLLDISNELNLSKKTFLSYSLAHHIGLSIDQKLVLLSLNSEIKRQKLIHEHLYNFVPMIRQAEEVKDRAAQNGHFKNLTPPSI